MVRVNTKREEDVRRLAKEVKQFFKIGGFDWQQRYDAVYVGRYAREKRWSHARLTRALETLDLRYRISVNHQLAKNKGGR